MSDDEPLAVTPAEEPLHGPDAAQRAIYARRPFGVTFVFIFVWFAAIADIIAGTTLLIMSFDDARFAGSAIDASAVRNFALATIVIGLLTAMVASSLGNGSQIARVLTVIVMATRLLSGLWALIALRDITLWPAVFDVVVAGVSIALLTNRSASDFFRARH